MSKGRALSAEDRHSLEALLGYAFSDKARLDRALTHSSARGSSGGDNYERLEFLGDRVLGLCIAELLFTTFRNADEGELSVRLNQLVSAQSCAEVADRMDLHKYIRTDSALRKGSGDRTKNVRADVVESLIAAIYIDGGLETARSFILKFWQEKATRPDAARRDAKTELQNWAHARFAISPTYRVDERSGPDHDPKFMVTVQVDGVEPETGSGRSKRAAEQVAATRMLVREGIWKAEEAEG